MIALFPSRTVAIELFGFGIHWYGLVYLAAFLLAYKLLPKLQKHRDLNLSREQWSDILAAAVLGVILGGRLGYVIFYAPGYFLQHPTEIIAVWNGGMSSHGGFIGASLALYFILKRTGVSWRAVADTIVVPVALGLALGRFGNFINYELYGTATNLPWAVAIPGVEGLRHPTFFYAIAKDLTIAIVCFWHLKKYATAGTTTAIGLVLYGVLRFIVEFFRVQSTANLDLGFFELTRGQILTLPLIGVGVWLILRIRKSY